MVEQMARAIMNPVNKKIAFLTFKIVEETIKRVCLKVEIDKLLPVYPDTVRLLKKSINEAEQMNNPIATVPDKASKTAASFTGINAAPGSLSIPRDTSPGSKPNNV